MIIRSFKAAVTREVRIQRLWSEQPFWQRNFHDRVIRDNNELARIRTYIANNPAAWLYDHENPDRAIDPDYARRWGWLENVDEP
jgi:hypothetical protein